MRKPENTDSVSVSAKFFAFFATETKYIKKRNDGDIPIICLMLAKSDIPAVSLSPI
mgnify:CR=1 FL=1